MGQKKDYRKEFDRMKNDLRYILGSVCCACGSNKMIQYHHILPLVLGGDNRLTNIVPLCSDCHAKIHGVKPLTQYAENTGRPRSTPVPNYRIILNKYIIGEIGTEQAKTMLKLKDGAKIAQQSYYKEYLKELGIRRIKRSGYLGYSNSIILYEDGHMELYTNGELRQKRRGLYAND